MTALIKTLRYFGVLLLIIVAIAGPLALVRGLQIKALMAAGENQVTPPETVTAAEVAAQTWETSISATGTIAPVQGVTVAAELSGKVAKIEF
jgi:membrane fusion protein (multidrug efflux system)